MGHLKSKFLIKLASNMHNAQPGTIGLATRRLCAGFSEELEIHLVEILCERVISTQNLQKGDRCKVVRA